jgi:hypothetical protein
VDVRKGVELEAENSLKFWEWSDVQSKYRLSAQVLAIACALLRGVRFCSQCTSWRMHLFGRVRHMD